MSRSLVAMNLMVPSQAYFLPCWDNTGRKGSPRLWQRRLVVESPILDCYTTACQNSVLCFLTMLLGMVQSLPLFVPSWATGVPFLEELWILSSPSPSSQVQDPHILLISRHDTLFSQSSKGQSLYLTNHLHL